MEVFQLCVQLADALQDLPVESNLFPAFFRAQRSSGSFNPSCLQTTAM